MSDWERSGDRWLHRPWWKVAINSALRWLQPWTARKWVVYTRTTETGNPPRVLAHGKSSPSRAARHGASSNCFSASSMVACLVVPLYSLGLECH